jgi:leucyl aminopeptidase
MGNDVAVRALQELDANTSFAVPVVFDDGAGRVAESVPGTIAGITLPREFSSEWCQARGLSERVGSAALLASVDGPSVVLVSLGASYNVVESYRLAVAAARSALRGQPLAFVLPTEAIEDVASVAQGVAEGALLSAYEFKTLDAPVNVSIVALGTPLPTIESHASAVEGARRGSIVAALTNWAKRLVDTPPNHMTPKELARTIAGAIGECDTTSVDVWTESKIRDERMGALLAVSSGSAEPARVVVASYEPAHAVAHIALVGKGITFDSGGLAIKPLNSMVEMKTDMSGAAVVSAVFIAAAKLALPIRLTLVVPMAENLLGDRAVKPSDVVYSRAGISIEVENPDAEGRLILADGLTLAVEANPDAIIDVATLTGAMCTALGDECAGFFATTTDLTERVLQASDASGEGFWPMPLFSKYEKDIASDVADLKNRGKPNGWGGAIWAALFLQRFTDGRPWAHLDIAGPARASSARGYTTKGGTAWGTRTLLALLTQVASERG